MAYETDDDDNLSLDKGISITKADIAEDESYAIFTQVNIVDNKLTATRYKRAQGSEESTPLRFEDEKLTPFNILDQFITEFPRP